MASSEGTNQSQDSAQVKSANSIFKYRKVFNDPIHGHIALHPVCVRIIDTPQFQRLRHIKQLDTCYMVYPGASHNRFEHSLGVCYLAGKLMNTLRERQPNLKITERDILCVEIAGLCHDLGQGPFSHVYEKKFMPKMKKQFTHEGAAKKMFKYMLEVNDGKVRKAIQEKIETCDIPGFKGFDDKDFTFIEEMIGDPKIIQNGEWPYKGRDIEKSFMYEIVANKRNGIDVDKWDYIARDSYMLGIKVNFDHNRCFASARVLEANGINGENGANVGKLKQICYRDISAQDLYDMFYTRMTLHRRAYQHKTHNIIGMMICDALIAADEHFKIGGKRFSEMLDDENDMEAYTHFTDDVIQMILYPQVNQNATENTQTETDVAGSITTNNKDLEHARTILQNILNRQLYKCVAQTQCMKGTVKDEAFKNQFDEILKQDGSSVQENFIDFDIISLDYGQGEKDPMKKVRFYSKDDIDLPIVLSREQVSYVLPKTFAEHIVRIYCKDTDKNSIKKVREAFVKWCEIHAHPLPKDIQRQIRIERQQPNAEPTEEDSQPASIENLDRKHLVEPNVVTADPEEDTEEPTSYHGGGIDTRAQQASTSDETNN